MSICKSCGRPVDGTAILQVRCDRMVKEIKELKAHPPLLVNPGKTQELIDHWKGEAEMWRDQARLRLNALDKIMRPWLEDKAKRGNVVSIDAALKKVREMLDAAPAPTQAVDTETGELLVAGGGQ